MPIHVLQRGDDLVVLPVVEGLHDDTDGNTYGNQENYQQKYSVEDLASVCKNITKSMDGGIVSKLIQEI